MKEKKKIEEKVKEKKVKPLWENLWNKNKVKKGKVAVLYLRNNGTAEPMEVESIKEMFTIHGKTYHEDSDCIYTIKKDRIPLAIIPEWSLIPLGTKVQADKPLLEKFSQLQDYCMRGIRHAERVRMGDKDGTKINPKAAILIIIGVIIAGALLINYL